MSDWLRNLLYLLFRAEADYPNAIERIFNRRLGLIDKEVVNSQPSYLCLDFWREMLTTLLRQLVQAKNEKSKFGINWMTITKAVNYDF